MAKNLIVSEAFGEYAKGARITDSKDIEAILASANAGSVLPIDVEDPAPPARSPSISPSAPD